MTTFLYTNTSMEGKLETRAYEISGDLTPENWELVKTTLGRLGIGMAAQPSSVTTKPVHEAQELPRAKEVWNPEEVSKGNLTKAKFNEFAESHRHFSKSLANRAWVILAQIYASKFFPEDWHSWRDPEEFQNSPLEYEITPPEPDMPFYTYCGKLDGLKPDSLVAFVKFLEEEIAEEGVIKSKDLPYGMGGHTVEFIRALSNSYSDSDKVNTKA